MGSLVDDDVEGGSVGGDGVVLSVGTGAGRPPPGPDEVVGSFGEVCARRIHELEGDEGGVRVVMGSVGVVHDVRVLVLWCLEDGSVDGQLIEGGELGAAFSSQVDGIMSRWAGLPLLSVVIGDCLDHDRRARLDTRDGLVYTVVRILLHPVGDPMSGEGGVVPNPIVSLLSFLDSTGPRS